MYLSSKAEEIYDRVQYEFSDKDRFNLYKHYLEEDCEDIDKFWDWWESLESSDIEEIGIYINKNFNNQKYLATYEYAILGKFTVVCGQGDVGEPREISSKIFDSEAAAIDYAQKQIKEISDNYGYNFVTVYDDDCEEIITLDK